MVTTDNAPAIKLDEIIVSRHPATIEFINRETGHDIPSVPTVTAEDVRGKHVYGNLPLTLAAEAAMVTTVTFETPVRGGMDLTIEEMREAGAKLETFVVCFMPPHPS